MADQTNPVDAPGAGKRFGIGFLVISLYVFFVLAVFSGFASYITRTEWQARLIEADAAHSLDTIVYLVARETALEKKIASNLTVVQDLDGKVDAINAKISEIKVRTDELDRRSKRAKQEERIFLGQLLPALNATDRQRLEAKLDTAGSGAGDIYQTRIVAEDIKAPDLQITQTGDDQATLLVRFEEISDEIDEIEAARTEFALTREQLANERDRHLEARSRPSKNLALFEAEQREIRTRLPVNSEERAQLGSLASILVGDFFQRLVSYPTIFLTMIVTMAAGGLGTVVSFSRRFYRENPEISVARLFVNVGEGIAAAIAIFLFSGAGMLVLTQGTGSQNAVELSPYTVAFVAFVSGFMAEDAFTSIQRAGKRIFSGNEEQAAVTPPPEASPESGSASTA